MSFITAYSKIKNNPIASESKPSLTDQKFKDQCDINFIVNQYVKLGIPIPQEQVNYGDLTDVKDYDEALMTVAQYKSAFESLPAVERERFHGDVREYLEFITNRDNLQEAYEKNYIDPNSVALDVVYPERYTKSSTNDLNPVNGQSESSGESQNNSSVEVS